MTVTYTSKVANADNSPFLRLLFRWRGSIYKLVWKEFIVFVVLYYVVGIIYRLALTGVHRKRFETLALYLKGNQANIPMAFILGFYVSLVVSRWWEQFNTIPWPDRMALFLSANIHGQDDRARKIRRTIMRYMALAYVVTMSSISPRIKKRFPTFASMTEAGFMLPNEQRIVEEMKTPYNKYFVPLVWSSSLMSRARKEGKIRDDMALKTLVDELNAYRGCLGTLFNFDWVTIPLVYTQVVTIAVYTFFLSQLIGGQFLLLDTEQEGTFVPKINSTDTVAKTTGDQWKFDVYIPVFTFLLFFFYMGWLKVAESMVNPFGGDDDDDFEISSTIDRNLQVSYLVVDEMHAEHPELLKDAYWDKKSEEVKLPDTGDKTPPPAHIGSAIEVKSVKPTEATPEEATTPTTPTKVVPTEATPTKSQPTASMAEEGRAGPKAEGSGSPKRASGSGGTKPASGSGGTKPASGSGGPKPASGSGPKSASASGSPKSAPPKSK